MKLIVQSVLRNRRVLNAAMHYSMQLYSTPTQQDTPSSLQSTTSTITTTTAIDYTLPLTLLAALAIVISYADRTNLATAIIPMTTEYKWDATFSGLVLSSFYSGYALTQIFGGRLADKYGGEVVTAAALLFWSACTALTPMAADMGAWPLLVTRVLLGAGEGLALPSIHSMLNKYANVNNRSLQVAFITAACYGGAVLSNLVSPSLIDMFGWRWCFYAFAGLPLLLWLPPWVKLFADIGNSNRSAIATDAVNAATKSVDAVATYSIDSESTGLNVFSKWKLFRKKQSRPSNDDNNNSNNNKTNNDSTNTSNSDITTTSNSSNNNNNNDNDDDMPDNYYNIGTLLKQPPVWAIIAAQYGQSWGMIGLLSWLPTYYNNKFNIPLESLAQFTVLPYILQFIVSIVAGIAADRAIAKGTRILKIRNFFQVLGMIIPAICLLVVAYAPSLATILLDLLSNIGTISISAIPPLLTGIVSPVVTLLRSQQQSLTPLLSNFQLSATQAATLITIGSAISAVTSAAVSCNHFELSPRNAGTIFGIGNTAGCIAGLVAVPVSGYLFELTKSWDIVFLLFAVHYVGGALLWLRWASDQRLNCNSTSTSVGVSERSN